MKSHCPLKAVLSTRGHEEPSFPAGHSSEGLYHTENGSESAHLPQ